MHKQWITVGMALGCAWALLRTCSAADDWPQWRGTRRDGAAPSFLAPKVWPPRLKRQWKVEVGQGHASPVVAGDRAFLFTREGENEVVRALRLRDGQPVWSRSYPAPYKMNHWARSHGKGPKSTPVVAAGRLTTLGISGILSCWDAQSGKRLWQHEFSDSYPQTAPLYGTAMSPMVEGRLVIAHVGGHDQGALRAFDLATGRPQWSWSGDGPGYASPIGVTLGGVRQVITQSQRANLGVSPSDGSVLWKMPFSTDYDQNVVTPVLAGQLVIFSGLNKGTIAYRLEQRGGKWTPKEVWHNADVPMYLSSPVVVGSRLVGLSHREKGQFFCLDVSTGKTLWTSEGRMCENAALLTAGNAVLALTTNAEWIVFRPDADRFRAMARYKVADTPVWAHPAVWGRRILIKDRSSLALWTLP